MKHLFCKTKYDGTPGVKVKFNPKNKYGDAPCCCEKGYLTKFSVSTWFCKVCNRLRARKLFKTSSFCKKFGWHKTCTTCNQCGTYNNPRNGKIQEPEIRIERGQE